MEFLKFGCRRSNSPYVCALGMPRAGAGCPAAGASIYFRPLAKNKMLPVTKGKSEAILRKCNCDTQCTAGRSAPQWRMQRCYKEKPQIFLSVVRHLVPEMELEVLSTMMHKWMALGVEDLQ